MRCRLLPTLGYPCLASAAVNVAVCVAGQHGG